MTEAVSDLHIETRDEVHQLREVVGRIHVALRKQADVLRLRDIHLPPPLVEALDRLEDGLSAFERSLNRSSPELDQLRALSKTYALINSSLDLDTILEQALDEIIKLTGASRGFIVLRDPDTQQLQFRTARGIDAHLLDAAPLNGAPASDADLVSDAARGEISRTIIYRVLETGQPLLTDNAADDPRMVGNETVARYGLRAVLCVPLRVGGATGSSDDLREEEADGAEPANGVIYVDNRYRHGVFSQRELNLLTAFGNQTGVAVENALLFAQVQATLREISRVNEMMENVFASIASGVITIDTEQRIATFNRAAGTILALLPEDAIGQAMGAVLPLNDEITAAIDAVRVNQERLSLETWAHIPTRGSRASLGIRFSPLQAAFDAAPDEGSASGVALLIDDMTQQREREQSLEMMRRYLPPGMIENIHQIANVALGGERREVTCVFLLTCPYAILSGTGRPQAMMAMLNIYLETATDVIHAANGVIDKYIGNEIMVVFNTQLNADPHHALSAVEMALHLVRAYRDLYARLGIDPDPHLYTVGIHTGIATLGNVGSEQRRNFTALGDTINLTKRIQDSAQPGQILLTGEAYDHMRASLHERSPSDPAPPMQIAPLPPMIVRGRQRETRLYQVFEQGTIQEYPHD